MCLGLLEKIDGYAIPDGIETEVYMHGNQEHGYIGLNVMKNWISEFDGPDSIVRIFK